MKRFVAVLVLLVAVTGCLPAPALAQELPAISVLVDRLPVVFDVEPTILGNRTMVPFRALGEALNVAVHWDGATRTITAKDGENIVRLQIANKVAYRNQQRLNLDVPPQIVGNRTLVPIRFFSEALACRVHWNASLRRVRIVSPPREMSVIGFYALGDSATSSWTNLFGQAYPEHGRGNTDVVDELAAGWYALDAAGNLLTRSRTGWQRPAGWESVLAAAAAYDVRAEMVVHETNRDHMLDRLLADDVAIAQAVEQITAEAAAHYAGVNLNLEGLGLRETDEQLRQVQDGFTKLAAALAASLHDQGLQLTLTLHAPNSAYRGYDYEALGAIADRIVIMAYDYGSKPEPEALVMQAVEQALHHVAPEKLVLGVSVPNENPASMLTKAGIAKRYRLQGIALWRLGLLTDEMWQALRSTIK